jgi:Ca2+-transporting ATPase
MAIGQLFLTYPSRHTWMRPLSNPYLHAAVAGGVAIQLAAASVPLVSTMLGGVSLPLELWAVVCVATLGAWGCAELISRVVWRQTTDAN